MMWTTVQLGINPKDFRQREPPGTPPPMDPHELPMPFSLIQRAQANTPSIQGPDPPNLPPNRWQGWKTQTGPTIADVEQSRRSPPVEHESEMPDAELKEAMAQSLREMRHDPYETPNTGGASGSGGAASAAPHQRLPQHKLERPILSLKEKTQSFLIDHQGSLLEEMLSNLRSQFQGHSHRMTSVRYWRTEWQERQ